MSLAHTRVFYTVLMEDDHSALAPLAGVAEESDPLAALLAPDCRMQNRYGDKARGENGLVACVRRLRRLQAALQPLPAATRQGLLVPVSARQSLIYFSLQLNCCDHPNKFYTKDCDAADEQSSTTVCITLGIGLEWERGVVTGVVLRHVLDAMDPNSFLSLVMYSTREEEFVNVERVLLSAAEAREISLPIQNASCEDCGIDLNDSTRSALASFVVKCVENTSRAQLPICEGSPPLKGKVHFNNVLHVMLVPTVNVRDEMSRSRSSTSACYYLPTDYQRFSRQRDLEIASVVREKGLKYEEALRTLYLLEGTAGTLYTEHNSNLGHSCEENENISRRDMTEELEESALKEETVDQAFIIQSDECCGSPTQSDTPFQEERNAALIVEDISMTNVDVKCDVTQTHQLKGTNVRESLKHQTDNNEYTHEYRGRLKGRELFRESVCVENNDYHKQQIAESWDDVCRSRSSSVPNFGNTNSAGVAASVSAIGSLDCGKHDLQDDYLQDVHLWQRQTLSNRPRAFSTEGRIQNIDHGESTKFVEEVHERVGWFPGKFLRKFHVDSDDDTEEYESSEQSISSDLCDGIYPNKISRNIGESSDCIVDEISNNAAEICSNDETTTGGDGSSSQSTINSDEENGWYFGKYLKRLLAKSSENTPQFSQKIHNHRDSVRLSKDMLRNLSAASSVPQSSHAHSHSKSDSNSESDSESDSENDSDSDDEEIGIHRRVQRVRLPRLPACGWLLGRSISRASLPIHGVVVQVKVLGCIGLKSNSILPPFSPISFVEVSVGDNAPICTSVAARTSHPNFEDDDIMTFSVNYTDVLDEYVLFTVYEKYILTGQKVPLYRAQLSLAAVSAQVDNSQPTAVTLKLFSFSEPCDVVGKGLYIPDSFDNWQKKNRGEDVGAPKSYDDLQREAYKVRTSIGGGSSLVRESTGSDFSSHSASTISLSISKSDRTMRSVLSQLRAVDIEEEKLCSQRLTLPSCRSLWIDEERCLS